MQCIGRGLTSLGKKSTGVIHVQPTPHLKLCGDHFLHSHIYLESDNSLLLVSCWILSSIVQDFHYSTGNQWEVQWLERCVSRSDPPLLAHSGLKVGPSTRLCPCELRSKDRGTRLLLWKATDYFGHLLRLTTSTHLTLTYCSYSGHAVVASSMRWRGCSLSKYKYQGST